jgi:hypothetical protein
LEAPLRQVDRHHADLRHPPPRTHRSFRRRTSRRARPPTVPCGSAKACSRAWPPCARRAARPRCAPARGGRRVKGTSPPAGRPA